jgi:hypothetical protein
LGFLISPLSDETVPLFGISAVRDLPLFGISYPEPRCRGFVILQKSVYRVAKRLADEGVNSPFVVVRNQETGIRRQETGIRKQESGDRIQESGDRKQESGNRNQETGFR